MANVQFSLQAVKGNYIAFNANYTLEQIQTRWTNKAFSP